MKDKLEPNMYVRTKKRTLQPPQIARIRNMSKDSGYKNQYYIELDKNLIPSYEYHIYEKDILKASHNIIDLIEVGDYVNGYYVSKIWKSGEITHYVDEKPIQRKEKQITIQAPSYGGIIHLHNEDIKSIVTKEQFGAMQYEIK